MASSNARKLGLRVGDSLRVRGLARSAATSLLADDAIACTIRTSGPATASLTFITALADVDAGALGRDADVGRAWLAYPKGASRTASARRAGEPLHRDTLQRRLLEDDLRIVTLISLSETWTAARIRRT